MKKIFRIMTLLMLGYCVAGSPVFAKTISGKVTAHDVRSGNLSVETVNPAAKAPENVSVSLGMTTRYSGVASAAEIQTGDRVWIETVQDAGPFAADSVKVSKG